MLEPARYAWGVCMAHADEKAVFSNDFFMPSACKTVPFELTRVFILKCPRQRPIRKQRDLAGKNGNAEELRGFSIVQSGAPVSTACGAKVALRRDQ